jgi:peptidyl-prolyl cis-trans isomerase B (cyclophilin B)
LILVCGGCGSNSENSGGAPAPADAAAKRGGSVDPLHPVILIDTSLGTIRIRLDAANAPGTVRNFLNYANDGFYQNTLIHYAAADKMIIGGGYAANGEAKRALTTVRNEAHNGLKNVRGTIAMARDASAGIDSASSQFFINLVDAPSLDHRGDTPDEYGYCVFGEIVDGLAVAERISRSPTRDQGGDLLQIPDPPVLVKSIQVVE